MIDTSLLNDNQKEAVLSDDKYLRIIAGAGSGKTRVLTMRIAHLIEDEDVRAYKILAITFTNKAANEMKERISAMLEDDTYQPWIATIHSTCVRILRNEISHLGYPSSFTILDGDDQKAIIKQGVKDLKLDKSEYNPGMVTGWISNNKTAEISVEAAREMMKNSYRAERLPDLYAYYNKRLEDLKALDFDDLILKTVRIFRDFPDIRQKWQNRFEYVLVDEFQDVDALQYKLIKYLAGNESSLYVVGDPDQTIYTWRGADVNIIMDFEKTFKPCKTVILNENYRSTEPILNAANALIKNNRNRLKKDLYTQKKSDEKVSYFMAMDEDYQALFIADQITKLHAQGKAYKDIAVLYRSNYLSRTLEKSLVDHQIPYIIYGGLRFYERQEIKDALCYLRMITTADDLALERIINKPKRGIGQKTLDNIRQEAQRQNTTMYEICRQGTLFSGKSKAAIAQFTDMVDRWRSKYDQDDTEYGDFLHMIISESGYDKVLEADLEKGEERIENIKTLEEDIRKFNQNNPDMVLDEYLQQLSLYTDRDNTDIKDYVQLMTVHAAKGLEFDTVFVSDLNEGIFPNNRALEESSRGIEEERRLAYVAFTRAKNKLYLTEAQGFSFILQSQRRTSRFIKEIDEDDIERAGVKKKAASVSSYGGTSVLRTAGGKSLDIAGLTGEKEKVPEKKKKNHLKKGDHVMHRIFGEGVVVNVTQGIARIAFSYPHGVKNILESHPSLTKKEN